jgi:hypothetical protein
LEADVPKLNLSQQTTDLIVSAVLNLAVAEIPELIKYFAARNETITEAGAIAQLEARGVSLIAKNEAWLILKGALSVTEDPPPDPTS